MDVSRLSVALIVCLPLLTSVPCAWGAYRDPSSKAQTQGEGKRRDNDVDQPEKDPTGQAAFSVQYLPEKTDFDLGAGPLTSQVLVTQPPHIHIQPSRVLREDDTLVTSMAPVVQATSSRGGLTASALPAQMDDVAGTPPFTMATWQGSNTLSPTDSTPPLQPLAGPRPTSTAAPRQEEVSPWGHRTLVIVTGHTVPAQGTESSGSVHVARLTVATSPPVKYSLQNEVQ